MKFAIFAGLPLPQWATAPPPPPPPHSPQPPPPPDVCYVWASDIYVLHSLRSTPGTVMFALSGGPHSVPAVDECAHFRQDWGRNHKASFTGLLSHVQTKEKRLQKGKSNKKYIYINYSVLCSSCGLLKYSGSNPTPVFFHKTQFSCSFIVHAIIVKWNLLFLKVFRCLSELLPPPPPPPQPPHSPTPTPTRCVLWMSQRYILYMSYILCATRHAL